MRLGLVIHSLAAGGAERVLSEMACFWAVRGLDVFLITFTGPERTDFYPVDERVKRVYLGQSKTTTGILEKLSFNLSRYAALRKAIRLIQPDVLVSFMDSTNVLSILATRGIGVRTIVSVRNNPASRFMPFAWRLARRLTYRRAHCVVVQTAGAGAWVREHCGGNVTVIPNPLRSVEVRRFPREPLVVSVGRMIPEKGHDVLLTAFARIAADFPAWNLAILGDGPLRGSLSAQIATLGLENRVLMPGTVRDVDAWLSRASVYAQASRSEGFPNSVLEAMAAGLPVVCTDCDFGPADMIANGSDGMLVPTEDPEALGRALADLMRDQNLRVRLGSAAVAVRDRYAKEKIMAQWETLLQS